MTETTLSRSRAGDEEAFRELVDPYRRLGVSVDHIAASSVMSREL